MLRWVRIAFKVIWYFLDSLFLEIGLQIAFFVIGVVSVHGDWMQGNSMMDSRDERNFITFGQLVPIILLMLPVMTAMEVYHGMLVSNIVIRQ
jgi:hypothetical protein